jgi:hypothetical protein
MKLSTDILVHQWLLMLESNENTKRFKESSSIFLEHTLGTSGHIVRCFSLVDSWRRQRSTIQNDNYFMF